MNRYCSNVVKINFEKQISETSSSSNTLGLSLSVKVKLDKIVNTFIQKLEKNFESNEKKVEVLNKLINKLNGLKYEKPKLTSMINYLINKLEEKKEKYSDDLNDIESIFNGIFE